MLDFFEQILGFFLALWDFLVSLIEGLIVAITAIADSGPLTLTLLGFMPSVVSASMLLVVSFSIVKFIIGRESE